MKKTKKNNNILKTVTEVFQKNKKKQNENVDEIDI